MCFTFVSVFILFLSVELYNGTYVVHACGLRASTQRVVNRIGNVLLGVAAALTTWVGIGCQPDCLTGDASEWLPPMRYSA